MSFKKKGGKKSEARLKNRGLRDIAWIDGFEHGPVDEKMEQPSVIYKFVEHVGGRSSEEIKKFFFPRTTGGINLKVKIVRTKL